METAPVGFGEAFFAWLDRASDELSIDFASKGGLSEPDIRQLEQQLAIPLPEDIRRFYSRFSVWGVLRDWLGWDQTKLRVRQEAVSICRWFPLTNAVTVPAVGTLSPR